MNHHMRSNQMTNMSHQQQQQLLQQQQQRAATAAAMAALNHQQQLLNHHHQQLQQQHHNQSQHHHQPAQRSVSSSVSGQQQHHAAHHQLPPQHHQHGRPPGQRNAPSQAVVNHVQHHQQLQQQHRNGPPIQQQAQQRSQQPTQQQQQRPQQQSGQQQQQPPPPLPPPLPKGWKKEETVRKRGLSAGLVDIAYYETSAPEKKFKTKLQLQKHFGDKYDMSLLDFRTGKLTQHVYKKHRRLKAIAANPNNYTLASKYDPYLNVPARQTASIFKQPVHYVSNNTKYGNEATPTYVNDFNAALAAPNSNVADQVTQAQLAVLSRKPTSTSRPCQLFWELRLNRIRAVEASDGDEDEFDADDDDELLFDKPVEFDLINLSKFKSLNISNETALRSVATAWYLNPNKLLLGQDKEFIKNPRVFIDRDQPLIPGITVKDEDIKLQEKKVKEIRERIRQAMSQLESMSGVDDDQLENIVDEKSNDNNNINFNTSQEESGGGVANDVEMVKVEPKEEKVAVADQSNGAQ